MSARSGHRTWNLGNMLVVVGLLALAATFAMPYVRAHRVADVELQAERLSARLLELAKSEEPIAFDDPDHRARIAERLRDAASSAAEPDASVPAPFDAPGGAADIGVYFRTKHYCYLLTRTPSDSRDPSIDSEDRPLEVYAWPRSHLSPGREIFFFPGDAGALYKGHRVQAARSRNLHKRYRGDRRMPRPGAGRPRDELKKDDPGLSYRGEDDERWMVLSGERPGAAEPR